MKGILSYYDLAKEADRRFRFMLNIEQKSFLRGKEVWNFSKDDIKKVIDNEQALYYYDKAREFISNYKRSKITLK